MRSSMLSVLSFSDGSTSTLSDGRKLPQSQARSKGVPCPSPSSSAWASPRGCDRRRGRGAGEIAANFSVQQIACKTLRLGGFPAECQSCPSRSVIKLPLVSISIRAHSQERDARRGSVVVPLTFRSCCAGRVGVRRGCSGSLSEHHRLRDLWIPRAGGVQVRRSPGLGGLHEEVLAPSWRRPERSGGELERLKTSDGLLRRPFCAAGTWRDPGV